jgi:GR25 family glycosyltransferase involved in LPS biosynthesis
LEHRLDRFTEINAELSNMRLEGERFNAISHSKGIVGCGYSHLEVLKLAKSRNYKNVLIFEDDFKLIIIVDITTPFHQDFLYSAAQIP